jgi:hypothetical protein
MSNNQVTEVSVAGAVTYWNLSPETNLAALNNGLATLGLQQFAAEERTACAALKSALSKTLLDAEFSRLVRPLEDPEDNGFALIEEERGTTENTYSTVLTAKVDKDGDIVTDADQAVVNELEEHFTYQKSILGVASVTAVLVNIVKHLDGTTLKPSGGVYWIPEHSLAKWAQVCEVIERAACGNTPSSIYQLRTVFDGAAVKAVKDAIINEVGQRSEEIRRRAASTGLGERAYKTQAKDAQRLHDRIKAYEGILGEALQELHTAADQTEQTVMDSALKSFPDFSLGAKKDAA